MSDRKHKAAVIAVASPRQGVGKSVIALNLAASLALAEKRVLLVVADPRHTVSLPHASKVSLYEVLRDGVTLGAAIVPTVLPQLEVVPSAPSLWRLNLELLYVRDREQRLRQALATVVEFYDCVLIDCPSSTGLLTISALLAADRVVVPVGATTSICAEAEQLLQMAASVRRSLQPALGGVQMVANKIARVGAESQPLAPQLSGVQIPASTDIATAAALGLPAVLHAADGVGAIAFRQLAAALSTSFAAPTVAQEQSL